MKLRTGLVALVLLLPACSDADTAVRAEQPPSPLPTATPSAIPTPTEVPTPSVVRTPPAPAISPQRVGPRPTGTVVATCPGVPAVGAATQVLLVVSTGSTARVRACERRDGLWVSVLGTMSGHVGGRGVAPAGAKREGDLRTPSGTFTLGRGFGQRADPGVVFPWQGVGPRDVWVDDPDSSLYNTWQQTPVAERWNSAEPLDVPAYAYAQVIDYNTARSPGRGSAIFLHVDLGRTTAGCVALPHPDLLRVLRWERPRAVVVIR